MKADVVAFDPGRRRKRPDPAPKPRPVEGFAHDPSARGYHVSYREHETNHCPGCGRTHWYVGRTTAECAFCATALPLQHVNDVQFTRGSEE